LAEWPAGEHTFEFANDLLENYGRDPEVTDLMNRVRTVFVPVVNPDGFNISREAGPYGVASWARHGVKRKNCRIVDGQEAADGVCGLLEHDDLGVDPNRNYGGFWGGPGADSHPTEETYRGAGPSSEPETRNVQDLVSRHQAVVLITNHTFGRQVLRPPGLRAESLTPDEDVYQELTAGITAQNGYTNQLGWEIYDTSGTTEDWSYYATGGLGLTFEIGDGGEEGRDFHPAFETVIDEYDGHRASNRAAFLVAMEAAANPDYHAVLQGAADPGSELQLRKEFTTELTPLAENWDDLVAQRAADTSEAGKVAVKDVWSSTMVVPASGRFEWHVNPSTRPALAHNPAGAGRERWTFTCRSPAGPVVERQVQVERGERLTIERPCDATR
jgi:carboxypeptidase T